MEITFARTEQILNTLPIGLYAGRRIRTSLSETEETSFYSPAEDEIVISYPIISHRMESVTDINREEEAVRSMLYHEVSHAILTPREMSCEDIYNIFEDERIETILRNYFMGVNFRQQLYDICGGIPKPTDAQSAFYNAVRFGTGTASIQKEIKKILKKSAKLNRATERWEPFDYKSYRLTDYEYDIRCLYVQIADEYKTNPQAFEQPVGQEGKNSGSGSGENAQFDQLKEGNTEQEENSENGSENTEGQAQEMNELEMTPEEVKKLVGACLSKNTALSAEQQKTIAEFQKTVETIIGNFNKKNSGGSGINAYSGVFNPRAVIRQDYRFFERSMATQGNNKFGTCHLNLIIDCSGSFWNNQSLTNSILATLSEVERKNRNFSMDVCFINDKFKKCKTVRERQMIADGGNKIPSDMKQIMIGLQKQQTCNYNIILFDGDAMCNNSFRSSEEYCERFQAFDMKQTTMITDPDNEEYTKNFKSTKIVVTKSYTNELIKHITQALVIAFA